MKNLPVLIIALISYLVFPVTAQVSFGEPKKINEEWKFILSDEANASQKEFDDTKWQTVCLPHDWSVKGQLSPTLASGTGYLPGGIGWYRKSILIPEDKMNEKIYLYFEGVYNRSEVYINGHLLGKRPNGYVSFLYDATPYIDFGKENVISVRVDHSQYADSRWYTGSGIYRNVWFVSANPVHIDAWGVFAYPIQKSNSRWSLNVQTEVVNETSTNSNLTIIHELLSPSGKVVTKSNQKLSVKGQDKGKIKTELSVNNPELWDLDNPNLYQLRTTIEQNGKTVDQTITKTGFRNFKFDPDKGFALNGKSMKMKGVCSHHDAGVLGSAVPREVWKRRILTLKEIGCNAVRTSHNPQAPDLYELCDELGMLVLNEAFDEWEFPKRKWLDGWNVGIPGFEGAYDYFEEWGERDLADMVKRDRNHVSVFAWSIGNEVDYPNDPYSHPVLDGGRETGFTQPIFGGYNPDAPDAMRLGGIAKRLVAVVKEYDPYRPTTAGLAGVAMSNETDYPGALDIAGYNYTESLYETDHKKYPKRILYGSENGHHIDAWKAVTDNDYIFGQFLWTGIDYLGESGRWPSRGFYSGLMDFGGFIKPRGYFRQSLWSNKPMAYLGTYPAPAEPNNRRLSMDAWSIWNYEDGQAIRVVCYTNTDKARLELNGQIVGQEKPYDPETGIIYWDLPYQSGKLEVIGLNKNNQELTRYAIQTSGRPYAITIQSADISQDGLAQVVIQVVDEKGNPVMISDDEVTCEINSSAYLLGLEASNNSDMGDYTDNVQRVFHGKLLTYIQSTDNKGEIKVKFSAPWLKSTEVTLKP